MSINSVTARNDYVGNNTTDEYDYDFKIFDQTHLKVIQTDTDGVETVLVLTTDYTVDGVSDTDGGTITLLDGNLPTSELLTILRDVPLDQDTSIRNQGAFYPEIHEDVFDRIIMQVQMLSEMISRSIQLPISTDPDDFDSVIESPLTADSLIMINSDGDGLELVPASNFSGQAGPPGPDGPAGAGILRAYTEAISNGVSTHTVTFSTPAPDANYILSSPAIVNTVDADPIFLQCIITAKTVNGFTVKFNSTTDSGNYNLEYNANVAI